MQDWAPAAEIAGAVRDGTSSAVSVAESALARIARRNEALNAFTADTT